MAKLINIRQPTAISGLSAKYPHPYTLASPISRYFDQAQTGVFAANVTATPIGPSPLGLSYVLTGTQALQSPVNKVIAGTFTMLVYFISDTTSDQAVASASSSYSSTIWAPTGGLIKYSDGVANWSTGVTVAAGIPYCVVVSQNGTAINMATNGQVVSATGTALSYTGKLTVGGRASSGDWPFTGKIALATAWDVALDIPSIRELSRNPWQLFEPISRPVFFPAVAGAATHPSSGDLTADSAVTAGTAGHVALHPSTGALSAQSAVTAGTAGHVGVHPSTGALSAQSAITAGTSGHVGMHPSTGAMDAQSAVTAGTASEDGSGAAHTSSGALSSQSAVTAGTAGHVGVHAATGALLAQSATTAGTAGHVAIHTSSGALTAGSAVVDGEAIAGIAQTLGGLPKIYYAKGETEAQKRKRRIEQGIIAPDPIGIEAPTPIDEPAETPQSAVKRRGTPWSTVLLDSSAALAEIERDARQKTARKQPETRPKAVETPQASTPPVAVDPHQQMLADIRVHVEQYVEQYLQRREAEQQAKADAEEEDDIAFVAMALFKATNHRNMRA